MASRRLLKVASLIRSELAEIIARKVKDPRLRGVSITSVEVSADLGRARVYYSVMDISRRQEVHEGLVAASPFLRRELGARLRLKMIPRLVPCYDPSIAEGARMDELIRRVREDDERRHAQVAAGPDQGD